MKERERKGKKTVELSVDLRGATEGCYEAHPTPQESSQTEGLNLACPFRKILCVVHLKARRGCQSQIPWCWSLRQL